jgi:transposase-like protein
VALKRGRKDLVMKTQQRLGPEFKRQIIEELLRRVNSPARMDRRYQIFAGFFYQWKKQYAKGAFENPPDQTAVLEERVRQLKQLVGKLTLKNGFLKKCCAAKPRTPAEKR